ncbi:MAG: hypothetical protein ACRETU_12735 [Steroidobacterales bacterium]
MRASLNSLGTFDSLWHGVSISDAEHSGTARHRDGVDLAMRPLGFPTQAGPTVAGSEPEANMIPHVGRQQQPGTMTPALASTNIRALRAVKLLHTVVWALFAACILWIPVVASFRRFNVAIALIAIVAIEVLVLLLNNFRCPLTGVAARYTEDRRDNFDIYLPLSVARYNKQIFGTLYVVGLVYTIVLWKLQ